jgi:hypothetical protein
MSVDIMCKSTYCPLSDICVRKQTNAVVGQPYNDFAPKCLPGGNMGNFYLCPDSDKKLLPFKPVWELMSSKYCGNFYYERVKWTEMYHSERVYVNIAVQWNGKKSYRMHIRNDNGSYESEEWYPTLEDLTALDWMIKR